MSEVSAAYQLAEHIHNSFYEQNDLLTSQEIEESGVKRGLSHLIGAPRVTGFEASGDRQWSQSLSKGRNGMFYLSTVYSGEGGKVIISHISPNAPLDRLEDLAGSIFMRALLKIAQERTGTIQYADGVGAWMHRDLQEPKRHPIASALEP